MKGSGYINEHGPYGIHKAYGIRMMHYPVEAITEIGLYNHMQRPTSKIVQAYPIVQLVNGYGIVSSAEVKHNYNRMYLTFNPAFTGWIIAVGRMFNLHYHSQSSPTGDVDIAHMLGAKAFLTMVDQEGTGAEIEGQITLTDDDNMNVALTPNASFEAGIHGLSAPMFRKYRINVTTPWQQNIIHNLGTSGLQRPPCVLLVDDSGIYVEAQIKHLDMNEIQLEFTENFTGYAYLLMG